MTAHSRRAAFLAVLVLTGGCADPGVTTPTLPTTLAGTPQSLTLTAAPLTVPATGASVRFSAVVTVRDGESLAGVPIEVRSRYDGQTEWTLNVLRTDASGRVDDAYFFANAGDLKARAGSLEQTVHVTKGAPAPGPTSPPPTCGGGSWPCPPPPPVPAPPPPSPAISVSVSPATATTDMEVGVTFTADAVLENGAAAVTSYVWDFGDGTPPVTTLPPTNFASHAYDVPLGLKTVTVTATNGSQSGTASSSITVTAPALLVSLAASTYTPAVGAPVIFTATVSSTGTVPPSLLFEWDEDGDGSYEWVAPLGASPSTRSIPFGEARVSTVGVRVTDPLTGRTATTTRQVTVS